jgi:RelB antitoxin
MPITDVVRARPSHDAKERASAALADMGIPMSDAIRLMMVGAGDPSSPLETAPSSAITGGALADDRGLIHLSLWECGRAGGSPIKAAHPACAAGIGSDRDQQEAPDFPNRPNWPIPARLFKSGPPAGPRGRGF